MDTYRNLPNKTLRLMRYVLAHPAGAWQGYCGPCCLPAVLPAPTRQPGETVAGCLTIAQAIRPALPCTGYTHVLKTDDDCYVRMPKVLEALQTPPPEAASAAEHLLAGGAAAAAGGAAPRLTPVRQGLREWMARDGGHPLHTDGINVYNATELVASAGAGGTAGGPGLGWGRRAKVIFSVRVLHGGRVAQRTRQCSVEHP